MDVFSTKVAYCDQQSLCDDEEGHYRYSVNERIASRYDVIELLGSGTFGKVLKCLDVITGLPVAVKIIRNIVKYREAAKLEYVVLCSLRQYDPGQEWHCVPLLDCFDYRHHVCFVFPLYGLSLYDFMVANMFKPFKMTQVKHMLWQLFRAVSYMHRLGFVHTDLKPENILLECSEYQLVNMKDLGQVRVPVDSRIKLCDFGSTAKVSAAKDVYTTIVSTRHYRAPEIILGHGWSLPCDMWSLGCIIVELVLGSALFHTHDNREHLAMMERVLGHIPVHVARKTSATNESAKYFTKDQRLNWPAIATSAESVAKVSRMVPLESMLVGASPLLVSLVRSLLVFEPDKRMTCVQALNHPFFLDDNIPLSVWDKQVMYSPDRKRQGNTSASTLKRRLMDDGVLSPPVTVS